MGPDYQPDLRRKNWRKCAGSGQYYDPATGRFLARQNQPGNPYLPKGVDPIGAMVGPLALVGLLTGKSKKKKLGLVMMVLMIVLASGVALAGCGTTISTTQIPPSTTSPGNQDGGPNPGGSPTNTPSSPGSPTSNPSPTETCTETPGPTDTPPNQGTPSPQDDILHITATTLAHYDMATYIKTVEAVQHPALLLARVAVGEGVQDNLEDQINIMWITKIRIAIGFSKYRAGYYQSLNPTDLVTELFATSPTTQYVTMPPFIDENNTYFIIYDSRHANACSNVLVRMGNPCSGSDTDALQNAYLKAQSIWNMPVNQAPESIQGFDSFWAHGTTASSCDTLEKPKEALRPPWHSQGNIGSVFYDCSFADNVNIFGKYMPPTSTP